MTTHIDPLLAKLLGSNSSSVFKFFFKRAVPTHKKDDKKLLKNYRLISLQLICGEIFK